MSASPTVRSVSSPSAKAASREWTKYADIKPSAAGVYEWRMPSVAVDGLIVCALARHRKRGAGYSETISPSFDHWDGYRVTVPEGLEWRSAPKGATLKPYQTIIWPEVGAIEKCRHCGKTPEWHSTWRLNSGGCIVSSDPHRMNRWWLSCCPWGKTPHMNDPRELIIERRRFLGLALADRRNEDRTESGEATEAPQ